MKTFELISIDDSFAVWRNKLNNLIDNIGDIQAFPPQTGNEGKLLTTDGVSVKWSEAKTSETPQPVTIPVSNSSGKISKEWLDISLDGSPNSIPQTDATGKIPSSVLYASETATPKTMPISDSTGKISKDWLKAYSTPVADSFVLTDSAGKIGLSFLNATETPTPNRLVVSLASGKIDPGWVPNIANVIGNVQITGPSAVSPGTTFKVQISAESLLKDVQISSFKWKFMGTIENTTPAVNGSAEISLQVTPGTSIGSVIPLNVTIQDSIGNEVKTSWNVTASSTSITVPSILSPSEGSFSFRDITMTCSSFAFTGGVDTHVASYWKACSDVTGTDTFWSSGKTTSDLTSVSFTLGSSIVGDVYLFTRHEGNSGISDWSVPVKVKIAKVLRPTIISPAVNSKVSPEFTVVSSQFNSELSDTHTSSDWRITTDLAGTILVKEDLNSSDKTSHTFNLTYSDSVLYLWSRYKGTKLGDSDWSEPVKVELMNAIVTPGGRKLYRHESGMGTVMEFNDGQPRRVLILNASYRNSIEFGLYGTDTPLKNYTSMNTRGDYYLNTSATANTEAATKMTDAQINTLWSTLIDSNTAKQNCDVWMSYSEEVVKFCRSITVNGVPCDLPNIQILMRIFLEANNIDNLDATASYNKSKALGKLNSRGYWKFDGDGKACSSTEYDSTSIRIMRFTGECTATAKNNILFVIPILELPITEIITPGGRKLYRHSSGKGTVMEFNDGKERKVIVLDAAYRGNATFGAYGTDSPLLNYASANTRGDWYLNTSNAVNNNAATKMTDAQINSLWSASIDNKTAKQNCDQWMTYSDTNAVRLCRNVYVDGKACDVPNIQTLMRIFLEADDLDKLDPTVAANKTKALGSQNSGGFWNCMGTNWAWSSTECNSRGVRYVDNNGYCNDASKSNGSFVIPILEIS